MNMQAAWKWYKTVLSSLARFFESGRCPVFIISALLFYQLFLASIAFSPVSAGGWGSFAEDFRIRCFNYDPATGWMQWSYVWIMLSFPFMLDAILLLVWMQPLKEMWSNQRSAFFPQIIAAFTIVMLLCGSLLFLETEDWSQELQPFPSERIRTEIEAPGFLLFNQEGKPISLDDFRGQVVVITAVYAACSLVCPQIIIQARELIEELSPDEQAKLTFMALSLDPEHENRELMSEFAHYYGADTGRFHFLNGDPEEIYSLLKRFQFARVNNPETGIIEHANLFVLIDREGKIAYRLTLSERHKAWMVAALRSLLSEASGNET